MFFYYFRAYQNAPLAQVFVEAMDKSFENVCELDLIFHADKVHYILDEIITGGLVLETNLSEITQAIEGQVSKRSILFAS